MNLAERYRRIEEITRYNNYYFGRIYTILSTPITDLAARMGLHPNIITLISLALGLTASVLFGIGGSIQILFGAVLLYISFVFDYSDGQVARFTNKTSPLGGWLDQICDRTKEFAYIYGLAFGYHRIHQDFTVFYWAMGALFFLFLLEYYGQMNRAIPQPKAADESADQPEGNMGGTNRRFIIDFSIDEQYLFVVVASILLGAKYSLIGLVLIGGLFAVYKALRGWQRYYQSIS